MPKRITVPISTARARLFQLADLVREAADHTAVVLEERSGRAPVVLVRESRLAFLEERVSQLEPQPAPASIAGTLSSSLDEVTLERALREIRGQWAAPQERGRAAAPLRRKAPKGRRRP